MKKRNKRIRTPIGFNKYFRFAIVGISIIFGLFFAFKAGSHRIKDLNQFKIKKIVVDRSVSFVKSRTLRNLKGKSIFKVDIKSIQRKLRGQYPQVAHLKVVKIFPDQIYVTAQKRDAIAQAILRNHNVMIDHEGVILAFVYEFNKALPVIRGLKSRDRNIQPGSYLSGPNTHAAIKIIKAYQNSQILSGYPIVKLDVRNLSKINMVTSNSLRIIMDREKIYHNFKILELMLSQGKIDFDKVKYVDLRFKEPIIKRK